MRPSLSTERLASRPVTDADADDVAVSLPRPREPGHWTARERATGAYAGWFEPRPPDDAPGTAEPGHRPDRAVRGLGYATEGARALGAKGFTELGVHRVTATTMAGNTASRRVMEKAGLSFVRLFHGDRADPIPGTEHGEGEYALPRERGEAAR